MRLEVCITTLELNRPLHPLKIKGFVMFLYLLVDETLENLAESWIYGVRGCQ